MKKVSVLISLLGLFYAVHAQQITISGTVTAGDTHEPLPGVSVLIKGTSNGVVTNLDGQYEIAAISGDTLQFSYVGYLNEEVAVSQQKVINVDLPLDVLSVDEVVVIGYGTVKKQDVTGAVAIVGADVIGEMKPVKAEQALQGTVAGVNITNQSGAPGADLDIRIRGVSTNGDASPLVMIDGAPGEMGLLGPNDIESITVLKDAQAAIYGTVAANGVILITTKKGKHNTRPTVSLNSSYGIQETTRKLPLLNATEYAVLLNESYAASGEALPYPDVSGLGQGTDWQDEIFEQSPIMNTDISVMGGTGKTSYALSASDLHQEGIIGADKTGYNRNTARMNLGIDLLDWLSFNSALTYTHAKRKSINDFSLGSVLFNAINMPSVYPVYDSDGEYFLAPTSLGNEIINPLAQIDNTYNDYHINKFNGNVGLTAKFASHFTATGRVGFNTSNDFYKSFAMEIDYGGKVFDKSRSSVTETRNNYNDYTFDFFVNYDNTLVDAHHITATIGTTIYKDWGSTLSATGYDIPYNSWEYADLDLADGVSESKSVGSGTWDYRRLSYFGRLQYDYVGKYLASFMLRRDASTRFGPDNASKIFPSATLGWKISEESFMPAWTFLNMMKLRASYGLMGSDKIDNYLYISQLNGEATYVLDGTLVNGKAIGVLPNTGVKWEEAEKFDVGLDARFFKNRFNLTADFFINNTNNLLLAAPVSGIYGTYAPGSGYPTVNAGSVRNTGVELAIGFKGSISSDFSYGINYNVTYLENKVTKVDNGTGYVEGGSFGVGQPSPARMEVGKPIGYYYGYVTDGIFQNQDEVDAHPSQLALGAEAQPGDIRFKDVNGDGELTTDDRTNIGDPIPDYTMGLNINLRYKAFDFVCYAYASIGNDIVRNYERVQANVNKLTYYMDRWTGEGTSNKVPRLTTASTANTIFSDFYVEDGSYLRIQNIQLGYTLPKQLTGKVKISECRFYTSISNLATFTQYMGFDPAASSGSPLGGGFDFGFYPAARTYTLGINLKF